jgi:thiamine kinase-like enzyme
MADNNQPDAAIILTAPVAHHLVSSFFPKEWATTDPSAVHTKEITGGLINSLQLIWRDNTALTEPSAILIRHFGRSGEIEEPPGTNTTLSAAQQAIVYWEMSRRGWGPEVYGFFAGGRLEEFFVRSRTLTAKEAGEVDVRCAVARSYARLHSLRLPLRQDSGRVVVREFVESVRRKGEGIIRMLREVGHPVVSRYADLFEEVDWVVELEWVVEMFEEHDCKVTVTHGDTNYLNVLVKSDVTATANRENRIVLIDYETVSYSYRGFDLGGHFSERIYCYSQPDSQLTDYDALDVEEQRSFCEAYLQELRDLGEELSEHDTVEHLIVEASIGRMYHALFTNMMCMVFDDDMELDPVFLGALLHMMETYKRLKRDFVASH